MEVRERRLETNIESERKIESETNVERQRIERERKRESETNVERETKGERDNHPRNAEA